MNDLLVVEKIAQWQKLKRLVLDRREGYWFFEEQQRGS
jgi:hypothetical protein